METDIHIRKKYITPFFYAQSKNMSLTDKLLSVFGQLIRKDI